MANNADQDQTAQIMLSFQKYLSVITVQTQIRLLTAPVELFSGPTL